MTAWVLLTALPPTKGHLRLVQFSQALDSDTRIIVATQPHEPYVYERVAAIREAVRPGTPVFHYDKTIEQDPTTPGFLDMWEDIYRGFGFSLGDTIVASERYGKTLAKHFGGVFMPYDIDREILPIKATNVRRSVLKRFDEMLPEFQRRITQRVTIFGAESTGKTTLSRTLAQYLDGHWLPEYARPYLEETVNEITTRSMTGIWQGQKALQKHARECFEGKPWIVQDTDLFSTVGYWDFWDMKTPPLLVTEAQAYSSDVYLITKSNIPFEVDPLRYGGDKRESEDQYWIDLCERYGLNYFVLEGKDPGVRLHEALDILDAHWAGAVRLDYEREHNE